MTRRREILRQNTSLVPSAYGKPLFFLDCLQLCDERFWTDLVGKKCFKLHNCEIDEDFGVLFDGSTSYGLYDGVVDPSPEISGHTIEIATGGLDDVKPQTNILTQDHAKGYSVCINDGGVYFYFLNTKRNIPTTTKLVSFYYYRLGSDKKYVVVADQASISTPDTNRTSITAFDADKTILGGFLHNGSLWNGYTGKIYALRIYDKMLTKEEMKRHQNADISRYGITLE